MKEINGRNMKDYKFFMNYLMKSDIIVERPLLTYAYMIHIENDFHAGKHFQAMMRLSCLIESILYELLLLKLPIPPQKFLAEEIRKMQEIPFGILIDWASGKPISKRQIKIVCYPNNWDTPMINKEETKILHNLREIRNDIAHNPVLTYDENLKKEVIEKIIKDVTPIQHKIIEKIIKITKEKSKNIS
jgi:hypothetical protein